MNPDSKIFGHSKYSWSFFYVGIVAIVAQWMYFLEREPITGRLQYVSLSPDKLASMESEIEGKAAKKCDVTPGHPTARVIESIYFRLNAAAGISNEGRECYFINAPTIVGGVVLHTGNSIIYSGTLNATTNQDEIAALLAPAHASRVLGHFGEVQSVNRMLKTIKAVCIPGLVIAETMMSRLPFVIGLGVIYVTRFLAQKRIEMDADYAAMLLMTDAGFVPRAAASVLQHPNRASKGHPQFNPYGRVVWRVFSSQDPERYQRNLAMIPEILQITGRQAIPTSLTGKERKALLAKKKRWDDFKKNRDKGTDCNNSEPELLPDPVWHDDSAF